MVPHGAAVGVLHKPLEKGGGLVIDPRSKMTLAGSELAC